MPLLVWIALAWLAGLALAHYGLVPAAVRPNSLLLVSLIPLAALAAWRRDRPMVLSSACLLLLLGGAGRYYAAVPRLDMPDALAYYNDTGWVAAEGIVDRHTDDRDASTLLTLAVDSLEIEGRHLDVRGTALVRAPRYAAYRYGDRLRVAGLLETPPEYEGFSYREYLARRGIYSVLNRPLIERIASGQGSPFWSTLYTIRDLGRDALARMLPDPEAALLQGIVLGIDSGIPEPLEDDFNTTGTSHIIVISGTNITIIAALLSHLFGRLLGKRRAYGLTLAGIGLYVLLVGADAAVVRAGLMGGLFVTARHLGRHATAHVSLLAAAMILTLISPLALWDLGFQLSFASTLSLILFGPALGRFTQAGLDRLLTHERARAAAAYGSDAVVVTLAAQVLTLPLIVLTFGRLSLVSPLANALILPVQPPIMILGGLATLLALVPPLVLAARLVAWVPWLCLAYTKGVVQWTARWPLAAVPVGRPAASIVVGGLVLAMAVAWAVRRRRSGPQPGPRPAARRVAAAPLLLLSLAALILAGLAVVQLPDGRLHVTFLDTGQGDAILITTPTGQQILVDGGPSPTGLTTALGREMPFWDRALDLLILTHPDVDHVTGLVEALDRYRVAGWLDGGPVGDDVLYLACRDRLEARGIPRMAARRGAQLDLGQGIVLEVLHPTGAAVAGREESSNYHSLVLRLEWGQVAFLLTGDIDAAAEGDLLQSGQALRADVLKVAHHGSGASTTAEFLEAVAPDFAVVSVGAGNRYGHPEAEVLERLAALPELTVMRTDDRGTVEFATDGRRLTVRTEK